MKKPFQKLQVLNDCALSVIQPKSHFSKCSIEFTTKAEFPNVVLYEKNKPKLNKVVSVHLIPILPLRTQI